MAPAALPPRRYPWYSFLLDFHLVMMLRIIRPLVLLRWSQWPRGLRCRTAVALFLGSLVRIPQGHGCLSLESSVLCQVEVPATSWSSVQRSPTDCDASLCVVWKPLECGGHGPPWAAAPQEKKIGLLRNHASILSMPSVLSPPILRPRHEVQESAELYFCYFYGANTDKFTFIFLGQTNF
jgi:hypothetical protein